ncbi:MAG: AAA family ATPase [Candidatus Paceibacterota bacterium]|jgi:dTMP kinase
MHTQNKFIVLEGTMGSGKTTLAKMLAERLGGVYYNTPASFRESRPVADKCLSIKARYHFYLSLNFQVSSEIGELLKEKTVVCDKYIWSTFCYHKTFGLNLPYFHKLDILMPDFCFLIICEDQVRLERISKRDPTNDYSKDFVRQESERRCLDEFKSVLPDVIIDNSSDGPQKAFFEIISIIK